VDAANAALGELLKTNSGAAKLVAVSASDSIVDIVAALAEADSLGLQGMKRRTRNIFLNVSSLFQVRSA